jgi:hypothetical protein
MDHVGLDDHVSVLPYFVGNLDFLCEIIAHSHTKMALLIRLLCCTLSPLLCISGQAKLHRAHASRLRGSVPTWSIPCDINMMPLNLRKQAAVLYV